MIKGHPRSAPKKQLVAYAKRRIVHVRVVDDNVGDAARRLAAARVPRRVIRRLSEPAS